MEFKQKHFARYFYRIQVRSVHCLVTESLSPLSEFYFNCWIYQSCLMVVKSICQN